MRTTYFRLIGLVVAGMLVVPAMAAGPRAQRKEVKKEAAAELKREMPAGERLAAFRKTVEELGLTEEQKAKLQTIFADAKAQLKELMDGFQNDQTPPEQRGEKLRAVVEGLRDKVLGVLDDTQKAQLKEKMEAVRTRLGDMFGQLQGALEKLDLTADQKDRIKTIMTDAREKFEAIRKEAQGDGAKDGLREKVRTLMQETKESIKGVLTEEQLRTLGSLVPADGPGGKKLDGLRKKGADGAGKKKGADDAGKKKGADDAGKKKGAADL